MLLVETAAPEPAIQSRPDRVLAPADLRRLSERSELVEQLGLQIFERGEAACVEPIRKTA